MTTLSTDKPRDFQLGEIESYPVVANDIIYEGAAVGENGAGYARPLVGGDKFLGFAIEKIDNTGGDAGDKRIRVRTRGRAKLKVSSAAITDNDLAAVYANDDDTFEKGASGGSLIGYVSQYESAGVAVVDFDAVYSKLG